MLERFQKQGFHQKLLITTFHSLGVRILRKCGKLLGYKPNFSICDSHSQKQLLIKIVKGMDLDPKKSKWDYRRLIKMIEDKKNQVLSDDEFELHLEEDYVKIFREYHKTLCSFNMYFIMSYKWTSGLLPYILHDGLYIGFTMAFISVS